MTWWDWCYISCISDFLIQGVTFWFSALPSTSIVSFCEGPCRAQMMVAHSDVETRGVSAERKQYSGHPPHHTPHSWSVLSYHHHQTNTFLLKHPAAYQWIIWNLNAVEQEMPLSLKQHHHRHMPAFTLKSHFCLHPAQQLARWSVRQVHEVSLSAGEYMSNQYPQQHFQSNVSQLWRLSTATRGQ